MDLSFHDLLAMYPWGLYACFFLGPFIQEDTAVIGAAASAVGGLGEPLLLFAVVLIGLVFSDLWKYWIGRAARTRDWARSYVEKWGVERTEARVVKRLGWSLMAVRFVPGARIAFYVAAGFFNAPFARFSFFIVLSAFIYIGIIFALFASLGAVAGEQARTWLPVGAVALIGTALLAQRLRRASTARAAA